MRGRDTLEEAGSPHGKGHDPQSLARYRRRLDFILGGMGPLGLETSDSI